MDFRAHAKVDGEKREKGEKEEDLQRPGFSCGGEELGFFDVPANATGRDDFLEGAASVDEVFDGRAVRDAAVAAASRCSYFFSSFKISRAAFEPEPPVRPAPGCVPLPQRYKFVIGVR